MNGFVESALDLDVEPYLLDDPRRITDGAPTVSLARIWSSADGSAVHGVWEMTEGTIEGFDRDETFVVVAGRATIRFTDRNTTAELVPGSVCVLHRGDPASITVHSTLRKVYAVFGTPAG